MKARLFAGPVAVLCALSFGMMGTASANEDQDPPTVAECGEQYDPIIVTPSYYAAHVAEPKYENFEISNGSATFTAGGLLIEATNGKVKGMLAPAAGTLLTEVGEPSLSMDFPGSVPGYNLQIDSDAFDQVDRPVTLVHEPEAEGPDWWSDYDLENGGAYAAGSRAFQGSLNDVLEIAPDAWVTEFGFSFGSGATGEGVLESLSFGCTDYYFSSIDASLVDVDCGSDGPYAKVSLVNEDSESVTFYLNDGEQTVPAGTTQTATVPLPEGEAELTVQALEITLLDFGFEDLDCPDEPSPSPSPTHDNSTPTPTPTTPAPTTSAPAPVVTTPASASTDTAVLGTKISKTSATAKAGGQLAHTGGNVAPLAFAGVLLLGLGATALVTTRRKNTGKHI